MNPRPSPVQIRLLRSNVLSTELTILHDHPYKGELTSQRSSRSFEYETDDISSELTLNGKIFVQFVALIYVSYINKAMQETGLYQKWTMNDLLDELNLIEVFETPDHQRIMGEITEKQKGLFTKLQIPLPSL